MQKMTQSFIVNEHPDLDTHMKEEQERLQPVVDKLLAVLKMEIDKSAIQRSDVERVLGTTMAYTLKECYPSSQEFANAVFLSHVNIEDMLAMLTEKTHQQEDMNKESYLSKRSLLLLCSQIPINIYMKERSDLHIL